MLKSVEIVEKLYKSVVRGSPTTTTWGGGTLGGVGGRRMSRLASSPSARSALTRRTTSMPFSPGCNVRRCPRSWPCQPGQHHVVARRQPLHLQWGVARPALVLCLVARPWRSFWTRHGGARGRRRRGKPWVSGEEHQEGGVQSCSPLTWWTSTRESESVKERVNGLVLRFSGRS